MFFVSFCFPPDCSGQNIAINTTGAAANAAALLDIGTAAGGDVLGILIPRVSLTATNSNAPIGAGVVTSLLVYNTATAGAAPDNVVPGYYYWNGTKWVSMSGGSGGNDWSLLGNAGTVDGTNFLGTTDNVALNFRVNNLKAGRIDPAGPTFLGYQAGNNNTATDGNTGIGYQALFTNAATGTRNTATGHKALYSNTDGTENVATGFYSLYSNTTGSYNTAAGTQALNGNTTGSANIAIGYGARAGTTGSYNIGIGTDALFNTTTGSYNTAVGSGNVFGVAGALYQNTTGSNNTALGYNAAYANVTGWSNTAAGKDALRNSTGSWNTATGDSAGYSNTSGTLNTYLGYKANGSATLANASAIGANASVTASNSLILGNAANVGIGTSAPSKKLHVVASDAATNTVTDVLLLEHTTSGAPAAGFGAGINFRLLDNWWGTTENAGRIQADWVDPGAWHLGELRFSSGLWGLGLADDMAEKLIIRGTLGELWGGCYTSELVLRGTSYDPGPIVFAPADLVKIKGELTNTTPATAASALSFFTRTGGGALTERVRINDAGDLIANTAITLGGVRRTTWPTGSGTGFGTDMGTYAYYTGGNVGFGTTVIPKGTVGYAKFAIEGTNASSAGPHVQYTTASDNYPLMQQLNWSHDNVSLNFDSYYDGGWKSADAGSNFQIYKISDLFRFRYVSGVAAGTGITWNEGMVMNTSGNIGIGNTAPGAKLEITGNLLFTKEAARTISVANSTTANTVGAALTMKAANGVGTANGGALNLQAGAGSGFATDGAVNITTTAGALVGGSINLTLPPSLLAGAINLTSGTSALDTWPGGNVNITAGAATVGNSAGGSINLTAGAGIGTGAAGYVGFLNSHLKSIQTTAPTIAVTTANGITTAAITAGSSDTKGNITTTGTNDNSANTQLTITFNKAYATAPTVVVTANNDAARTATWYVTSAAATCSLFIRAGGATPAFNYMIIE